MDIYISDIGLVVITDPDNDDELLGFNVMVGGGMGRTHNKENTFARAADHLGFVHKDDVMEGMDNSLGRMEADILMHLDARLRRPRSTRRSCVLPRFEDVNGSYVMMNFSWWLTMVYKLIDEIGLSA